jgi:hypothetical protein
LKSKATFSKGCAKSTSILENPLLEKWSKNPRPLLEKVEQNKRLLQ